ncbi:alanyl-tRNA editing protein [Hahella sp. NBU794]|uniref:alanyl-tRNA editing protein n=1 Tax=Hahella sp. NBU794 TaxID=3422590 RepID=UPI003D6E6807
MTRKIFWEDPYLTTLSTYVTGVQGAAVTVEETIFYAFSGGQESDHGTIGGFRVISARKEEQEIFYELPQDHALQVGDPVEITIDWERRYRLMRLHFAAELVLELFYRKLGGVDKVGAHIAEEKARIDFSWPQSISPLLPDIDADAQRLIDENRDIISAFSDADAERRYWRVEGFAEVPCGGTHLTRTGEVGRISMKRKNVGKGKERVEIYLS